MNRFHYHFLTATKRLLRWALNRMFGEKIAIYFSPLRWANGLDLQFHSPLKTRFLEQAMRCWRSHDQPRRYLKPGTSLADFFSAMNADGIRYLVLRWFESLPDVQPGEDIDLLIADEDVAKLEKWLLPHQTNNSQPFDIYSVSGVSGTQFRNALPYFPAHLSGELLRKRVQLPNGVFAPDPRLHWLSLGFHAVYHKAEKSGFPVAANDRKFAQNSDHDYQRALEKIGEKAGFPVPNNLTDLDKTLFEHNWAPPVDFARKLAENHSPWLLKKYPRSDAAFWENNRQTDTRVSVFLVREWAQKHALVDLVRKTIERQGFEIVLDAALTENQQEIAATRLRGGNWNRGPYPVCGGRPVWCFVALDQTPPEIPGKLQKQLPFLNNPNTFWVKQSLRDAINTQLPPAQQVNFLHACDDHAEAREYLQLLFPEKYDDICQKICQMIAQFQTPETVIRQLSRHSRRAIVELIEWRGETAVRKTFKSGRSRFLAREVELLQYFGAEGQPVPQLLENGENYLISSFVDGETQISYRKKQITAINSFLKFLFENGYAHLDFKPDSLIWKNDGLVAVIDFEYCQKYDVQPTEFRDSYDLRGAPPAFTGDIPVGGQAFIDHCWRKSAGKPLRKRMF
ncbi:MAG: hypothetical protein R3C41_07820 [Calditrichia bacterium]